MMVIHCKQLKTTQILEKICNVLHYGNVLQYGNVLHYDLSMSTEFEKFPYLYVIPVSARFYKPSILFLWNLLNK